MSQMIKLNKTYESVFNHSGYKISSIGTPAGVALGYALSHHQMDMDQFIEDNNKCRDANDCSFTKSMVKSLLSEAIERHMYTSICKIFNSKKMLSIIGTSSTSLEYLKDIVIESTKIGTFSKELLLGIFGAGTNNAFIKHISHYTLLDIGSGLSDVQDYIDAQDMLLDHLNEGFGEKLISALKGLDQDKYKDFLQGSSRKLINTVSNDEDLAKVNRELVHKYTSPKFDESLTKDSAKAKVKAMREFLKVFVKSNEDYQDYLLQDISVTSYYKSFFPKVDSPREEVIEFLGLKKTDKLADYFLSNMKQDSMSFYSSVLGSLTGHEAKQLKYFIRSIPDEAMTSLSRSEIGKELIKSICKAYTSYYVAKDQVSRGNDYAMENILGSSNKYFSALLEEGAIYSNQSWSFFVQFYSGLQVGKIKAQIIPQISEAFISTIEESNTHDYVKYFQDIFKNMRQEEDWKKFSYYEKIMKAFYEKSACDGALISALDFTMMVEVSDPHANDLKMRDIFKKYASCYGLEKALESKTGLGSESSAKGGLTDYKRYNSDPLTNYLCESLDIGYLIDEVHRQKTAKDSLGCGEVSKTQCKAHIEEAVSAFNKGDRGKCEVPPAVEPEQIIPTLGEANKVYDIGVIILTGYLIHARNYHATISIIPILYKGLAELISVESFSTLAESLGQAASSAVFSITKIFGINKQAYDKYEGDLITSMREVFVPYHDGIKRQDIKAEYRQNFEKFKNDVSVETNLLKAKEEPNVKHSLAANNIIQAVRVAKFVADVLDKKDITHKDAIAGVALPLLNVAVAIAMPNHAREYKVLKTLILMGTSFISYSISSGDADSFLDSFKDTKPVDGLAEGVSVDEDNPSADGIPTEGVPVDEDNPSADGIPTEGVPVDEDNPSADGIPTEGVSADEDNPSADGIPTEGVPVDEDNLSADGIPTEEVPVSEMTLDNAAGTDELNVGNNTYVIDQNE